MRTIVPFVLSPLVFSIVVCAQPRQPNSADQIARFEKRVADSQTSVQERLNLVNLYFNSSNVEARRRHILWLIENRPQLSELRNIQFQLDAPGRPPDREGLAQATRLWHEQGEKPGASPKAIANAVWFFRFEDRATAKALIETGRLTHPGDPDLARMRGMLDAIAILALKGENPVLIDSALERSPEAARARDDIEASKDPALIVSAADFLQQHLNQFNERNALGGEDPLTVAERWLLRVRDIAPDVPREVADWKSTLVRVYEREAGQAADPSWKVQLYRKADALDPAWNGLPNLALAEIDMADDDAASHDAHRLLDRGNAPPTFTHVGHTILGRIALAHGNVAEAKAELFASVPAVIPPGMNLEPNRTLAQDLIDYGERDAVIQFLEQCREFWKNDRGSIDHYIKVVKAPGTHDILSFYAAGSDLRGRPAPKLPIEDHSGKVVAVQFRNASCKSCKAQFATMETIADKREVFAASIDTAEQKALTAQLEVETMPTVVIIGRDGRVADYLTGNVPETQLRATIERLAGQGGAQKLPAPVQIAADGPRILAWSPVPGAESYIVQWDQRDEKGWVSDRDDHLVRVIPAHETSVKLDPGLGETPAESFRWRVFAVNRFGPGSVSEWREAWPLEP